MTSNNSTWEYRQRDLTGLTPGNIEALLAAMGIDQWELVSIDTRSSLFNSKTIAYFKRKL